MPNALNLRGLIPATILPMTADYTVDEPALRRYCRWLLAHEGLAGVAVNVDTGEGPNLTREERRLVLDVWVDEARGAVPVVAGIPGPTVETAVAAARDAAAAGASALLVFPVPAFRAPSLDPEVLYAHHRAIEAAAGLPLVLFQLQAALGGAIFEDSCLERLLSIQSVVAIKEASFDAAQFARVRRLVSDAPNPVTLLTGNDTFIYESFLLGAEGALIGFGTLAVTEQIRMIRASLAGQAEAAERLNAVIGPLSRAIFASPVTGYRARLKFALSLLGVMDCAAVRPPLVPLSESARAKVRRALETAALLPADGSIAEVL